MGGGGIHLVGRPGEECNHSVLVYIFELAKKLEKIEKVELGVQKVLTMNSMSSPKNWKG